MACGSAPMRGPGRSPERITANTCNVKGTGVTGIVIWAAAAVTAAIKAARVMVDAFNASLSVQETIAPATTVRPRPLLPPFAPGFRRHGHRHRWRLVSRAFG